MFDKKPMIFRWLKIIIIVLVAVLITVNMVYIKQICSTRQYFITNISTALLLVWATVFWILVLRCSKKE